MQFPGLGKYAALGSIMAARSNNLAAQNQSGIGPTYISPTVESQFTPLQGPDNALEMGVNSPGAGREIKQLDQTSPMQAGAAPELPKAPGDITLPPMPASSMIRDVAKGRTAPPASSMASFVQNSNRKYRNAF